MHHLNILGNFFEVHCCGRHFLEFYLLNSYTSEALSRPIRVHNLIDYLVIATLNEVIIFLFSLFKDLFQRQGRFFFWCASAQDKS